MPALKFTQSTPPDLLEAWLFMAEENLSAADRLLELTEREAQTLLLQPLTGRKRPELATNVRSWITSTPNVQESQ